MTVDPQFALIRNLNDAGCDAHTTEKILQFHAEGKREEELRLLKQHRRNLLNEVHDNQKKIDCLDFLTCKLEQENFLSNNSRIPT